jgi:hypothetical protein
LHGSCYLTPSYLEKPHELAYSIEHKLHGQRCKQNAEHTCDDVQATWTEQPHQSLGPETDDEAREQEDERQGACDRSKLSQAAACLACK